MSPETILPYVFSPCYFYNKKYYPPFLSGSAYIVPGYLVKKWFDVALTQQYFHIEDVFMTGLVTTAGGIPILNNRKIQPFPFLKIKLQTDFISVHYMKEGDKLELHAIMKKYYSLRGIAPQNITIKDIR